jgi:outer membrane protein assembly factor BamB
MAIIACERPVAGQPPAVAFPGGVIWQFALPAPPAQRPAYDDALLYVALRDGVLLAIDHATGVPAWSANRDATVAPVSTGLHLAGASGANAWALDAATGRTRWQHDLGAVVILPPVSADTGLLFLTAANDAVLLAVDDGRELWRQPINGRAMSVAAAAGGRAWIGLDDGRLLAMQTSTGAIRWTRTLPGAAFVMTPLGDRLLVGSADNFLYALRDKDGGTAWRWRTGGDVVGAATADARRVYFVSLDATLRAIDLRHGDLRWQRPLAARPVGGPAFAGDVLVVAGVSPELRGYKVSDGGPAGSAPLPGRALHGPLVAAARGSVPARVLIMTAGGQVLAIGQTVEPRLVPLEFVPGKPLRPEVLPPIR